MQNHSRETPHLDTVFVYGGSTSPASPPRSSCWSGGVRVTHLCLGLHGRRPGPATRRLPVSNARPGQTDVGNRSFKTRACLRATTEPAERPAHVRWQPMEP